MPLPPRISKSSTRLLHATLAFVLLLSTSAVTAQADKALYATGEKVFKANCASCHKPDTKMTGPMLKGTKAKWEGKGDIYLFAYPHRTKFSADMCWKDRIKYRR